MRLVATIVAAVMLLGAASPALCARVCPELQEHHPQAATSGHGAHHQHAQETVFENASGCGMLEADERPAAVTSKVSLPTADAAAATAPLAAVPLPQPHQALPFSSASPPGLDARGAPLILRI